MPQRIYSLGAMARYWAGQKLLHSPLHPFYLKISGKEQAPFTYEEFLAAEAAHSPMVPSAEIDPALHGYELVLEPGVHPSPYAVGLLLQEALRSDADLVYADEDVLDPGTGRRHSPVFKPGPSPQLAASCDYIGGCFLRRQAAEKATCKLARVPAVLFHRDSARPIVFAQEASPPSSANPGSVSVVICSRTPTLLEACLHCIRERTSYPSLEILIVDHISPTNPGMPGLIERHRASRVPWREEFHFGRMCNAAAQQATGNFLLFLNDDTTTIHPDWLTCMAAQANNPGHGAVGSLLYYPDGRIQHAGVLVGTPNGAGHPGRLSRGSAIWPWLEMTREVSAVTGACLLIRRDLFHQLGGFDDCFPVNYNDVDLCLRVRKAGYQVILEAQSRLLHHESTTRKTGIRYRERQRFLDRWSSVIQAGDSFFNPNLTDNEELLPNPEIFAIKDKRV